MKGQKTVEIEFKPLKGFRKLCNKCGKVFDTKMKEQVVCEPCVEKAMKKESFNYKGKEK